jgi:hypothetical protein
MSLRNSAGSSIGGAVTSFGWSSRGSGGHHDSGFNDSGFNDSGFNDSGFTRQVTLGLLRWFISEVAFCEIDLGARALRPAFSHSVRG